MSSRILLSALRRQGPRLFSAVPEPWVPLSSAAGARTLLSGSAGSRAAPRPPNAFLRAAPVSATRPFSSSSAAAATVSNAQNKAAPAASPAKKEEKEVGSYWGLAPPKLYKADGTEWKWSCFLPWDSYSADVAIDLEKHHVPTTMGDRFARWLVKTLRVPTDIFFQPMIRTVH